jgi:hypothetical protein
MNGTGWTDSNRHTINEIKKKMNQFKYIITRDDKISIFSELISLLSTEQGQDILEKSFKFRQTVIDKLHEFKSSVCDDRVKSWCEQLGLGSMESREA